MSAAGITLQWPPVTAPANKWRTRVEDLRNLLCVRFGHILTVRHVRARVSITDDASLLLLIALLLSLSTSLSITTARSVVIGPHSCYEHIVLFRTCMRAYMCTCNQRQKYGCGNYAEHLTRVGGRTLAYMYTRRAFYSTQRKNIQKMG